MVDVLWVHAVWRIGLQHHLLDPALVDEVVDVGAAPRAGEGVVDVGDRHAHRLCLMRVDFQLEFRRVFLPIRAYRHQTLVLGQFGQQLITRLHQRGVTQIGAVLQHQIEAGGIAQLRHRRRCERKHLGIADTGKKCPGLGRHVGDALALTGALVPRPQLDEGKAHVLAATGKTETGHGEDTGNRLLLIDQEMMLHLLEHIAGARIGGTGRQLHQHEQGALVFVRQESHRQFHEPEHHQGQQRGVGEHVAPALAKHVPHHALVAGVAAIEQAVEPTEEPGGRQAMALVDRLEQGGAQGRGQDHRHQHRQGHGRDNRDRELPVDHAGGAAEKRHRDEHRRQHQRHADQCAGNLVHRFTRGVLGR